MDTGGATIVSSYPAMTSTGGSFEDGTIHSNTTAASTAKMKSNKARMKASAGAARQQKNPQVDIRSLRSTSSAEGDEHQHSAPEVKMETSGATTNSAIAANVKNNNNNNMDCKSSGVNEDEATLQKQSKHTRSPGDSNATEGKREVLVDAVGEELSHSKGSELSSTTKASSGDAKSTAGTDGEDDDDNWESLIDNGTLDKSLEKLRIKGSAPLNDSNYQKDYQKDQPKKEKVKGPIKVNVRLEEPSRCSTPPTFKILRRETATSGGGHPSSVANGETKRHFVGDISGNGQTAEARRTGGHNGVPTPPAGKTFAQRQEEYARARMRILGCPGNGNGNTSAAAASPTSQPRNHNGPPATQKPMCVNVGRGFGPDSMGGGRRGSYPGGPHRRHNPGAQTSGYAYGNNSLHLQQQHHQNNNNPYHQSNNGYYGGNRVTAGLHVGPLSNGSFHGATGSAQHPSSSSAAGAMHRTNGGTYSR